MKKYLLLSILIAMTSLKGHSLTLRGDTTILPQPDSIRVSVQDARRRLIQARQSLELRRLVDSLNVQLSKYSEEIRFYEAEVVALKQSDSASQQQIGRYEQIIENDKEKEKIMQDQVDTLTKLLGRAEVRTKAVAGVGVLLTVVALLIDKFTSIFH